MKCHFLVQGSAQSLRHRLRDTGRNPQGAKALRRSSIGITAMRREFSYEFAVNKRASFSLCIDALGFGCGQPLFHDEGIT